jgi:hypothetical protein
MEIIVVSKGDSSRLHSLKWLNRYGFQYTVVTHTAAQARTLRKFSNGNRVIQTGKAFLYENRNWIMQNLVAPGEWYIGMDDNVQRLNCVRKDYYDWDFIDNRDKPRNARSWREVYRTNATRQLSPICDELMRQCEANGTVYGGFSSMENPFFRMRHWVHIRYVKSKLFVMKNEPGLRWKYMHAHDIGLSVDTMVKYGCIVVNNFVHPLCTMYEPGGLGSSAERCDARRQTIQQIVVEYPGLVRLVEKGRGKSPVARFAVTSKEGLAKWKQNYIKELI